MRGKFKRKLGVTGAILGLVAGLLWQFSPLPAVVSVAHLSDPAKLATLGRRGANPRVNKIVYWLEHGQQRHLAYDQTLDWALFLNRTPAPRSDLVKETSLRNMKIASELGLLTAPNLEKLRRGNAAEVTKGPYSGDKVEIDHIVPISLAPELGNELANLEMMPSRLNRSKSNKVGQRQLSYAEKFAAAGLLGTNSMQRLKSESPLRRGLPPVTPSHL